MCPWSQTPPRRTPRLPVNSQPSWKMPEMANAARIWALSAVARRVRRLAQVPRVAPFGARLSESLIRLRVWLTGGQARPLRRPHGRQQGRPGWPGTPNHGYWGVYGFNEHSNYARLARVAVASHSRRPILLIDRSRKAGSATSIGSTRTGQASFRVFAPARR